MHNNQIQYKTNTNIDMKLLSHVAQSTKSTGNCVKMIKKSAETQYHSDPLRVPFGKFLNDF